MSEADMIEKLINQINTLKTVKKVFMNKRDIKIYDNSWHNISEYHTEYDINIITKMIDPLEWQQIVALERDFDKLFPQFKFYYHLIESDSGISNQNSSKEGKLIYDSEANLNNNSVQDMR